MKCPGQDTLYWKPGAIFEVNCPNCDRPVEFFKDDTSRKCSHCGHRFVNPNMDFGCAAYCQYAEQCLGTLPEEVRVQKEDLLKDKVAVEMKRTFKRDFKRIGQATRRARYAERIAGKVRGTLPVVLCAAYLRDIGVPQALRKVRGHHARPFGTGKSGSCQGDSHRIAGERSAHRCRLHHCRSPSCPGFGRTTGSQDCLRCGLGGTDGRTSQVSAAG